MEVIIATGADKKNRRRVETVFALDSTTRSIALCSDAMNEGLNLQGASSDRAPRSAHHPAASLNNASDESTAWTAHTI